MRVAKGLKLAAGLFALLPLGLTLNAGSAHAQYYSRCEAEVPVYVDPTPSFPNSGDEYYIYNPVSTYECAEAASAVSAVASNLSAVGDSFVQQQLNMGGIGAFGTFASPTGKLRHSDHGGLTEIGSGGFVTEGFETSEGSVFANGTYDLPGTTFGGHVRLSALAGYDRLNQKSDSASFKTEIDSFIYGGSYLWSSGSFYTMSLIIGLAGDAEGSNAGGTYDYGLSGYYSNSVVGNTFDLGALKFDARLGLGHHDINGGSFVVPGTITVLKGDTSAWNGSFTGTLFTIVTMDNGAVARPYILGSYKHVFDEDIDITSSAGTVLSYDQADDYGKVEFGFDVVQGPVTFGTAIYTEFSNDETTVGGRVGASFKLQ
jgi:hypothetical protein